jgi:hypothetical protein
MTKRVTERLTLEELTKLYAQKQFLASQTAKDKMLDAVGCLCGLQSQMPLTPCLSLWNRVKDFESGMLDRTLYETKSLVKTWCMRGTAHVIPSKDLPVYHNALEKMWFEHHGRFMRKPDWPAREERRSVIYPEILKALGNGPLKRRELNDKVRAMLGDYLKPYPRLFSGWGGILKETSYLGMTVFAEPSGREASFARLDQWLPETDLYAIDEGRARDQLLLKYLRGYGPASAQDFSYWSGLMVGEAKAAIENDKARLTEVRVEGSEPSLWMLKEDRKQLEKLDSEEVMPPRLLPKFDSYLLGHKDRRSLIEPQFLKCVCRPAGDIAAVLLVDGRVAGTWTHKKTKKKLTVAITPFRKLDKATTDELEQVTANLGAFMKIPETKTLLA